MCLVMCSDPHSKAKDQELKCFQFLHLENIFFNKPGEYEPKESNIKGGYQLLQRKTKEELFVRTVQIFT